MGLQVMAYLDDWLVGAMTKQVCLQAAKKVMAFLESLGFQINLKKSRLIPAQTFQRLGLEWNLTSHNLYLPQERRVGIAKQV